MKISTQLFLKLFVISALTHYALQSAESKTIANELSSLSNQLEQLAYLNTPFPNQISLPNNIRILDQNINTKKAPALSNLKAFAHATGIELIQLVVADQDLSMATFCQKKDDVEKQLEKLVALESGNPTLKIIECLLFDQSNKDLKKDLTDAKIDANLGYSIGGGSASCGYHTLSHLQTLHNFFNDNKNLDHLLSLVYVNGLFGLSEINDAFNLARTTQIPSPGIWRKEIKIEYDKRYKSAQERFIKTNPLPAKTTFEKWMQTNEEMHKKFKESFSSIATKDGEWLRDSGMTHLENNIDILKKIKFGLWYAAIEEIELQVLQNAVKTYPFQLPITVNENNSHWYGVYLQQKTVKNNIVCIIVDSKNDPRYNEPLVINMLTTLFPDKAKIIRSNQYLLAVQDTAKASPEIERITTLRTLAPIEQQAKLKKDLASLKPLSDAELLFIFNEFAYFELTRDILQDYKIFIGAYQLLKSKKTISDLDSYIQKQTGKDLALANSAAQQIFAIFG